MFFPSVLNSIAGYDPPLKSTDVLCAVAKASKAVWYLVILFLLYYLLVLWFSIYSWVVYLAVVTGDIFYDALLEGLGVWLLTLQQLYFAVIMFKRKLAPTLSLSCWSATHLHIHQLPLHDPFSVLSIDIWIPIVPTTETPIPGLHSMLPLYAELHSLFCFSSKPAFRILCFYFFLQIQLAEKMSSFWQMCLHFI